MQPVHRLIAPASGGSGYEEQLQTQTKNEAESRADDIAKKSLNPSREERVITSVFQNLSIKSDEEKKIPFPGQAKLENTEELSPEDQYEKDVDDFIKELVAVGVKKDVIELKNEIFRDKKLTLTYTWFELDAPTITSLLLKACKLTKLEELDLHSTKLTTLPSEIRHFTELKRLRLDSTGLTTLPQEIGLLTKLEMLRVSDTLLTIFPQELVKLKELKELNLSFTELTTLPQEIGLLTKMERLNVSNTALTTLPPEIGQLTKLDGLWLWRTPITTLPCSITNCRVLTILHLDETPLAERGDEVTMGRQELQGYFGERVVLP